MLDVKCSPTHLGLVVVLKGVNDQNFRFEVSESDLFEDFFQPLTALASSASNCGMIFYSLNGIRRGGGEGCTDGKIYGRLPLCQNTTADGAE